MNRQAARERECADREGAACARLSRELGWTAGVSWDHCDACFSREAPIVPTVKGAVIRDIVARPRAGWSEEVALAMADRHGSIDEAAAFVIEAVPMFDRVIVGELMHTILMRAKREGASHEWQQRFIDRLDQADIEAATRQETPRTRDAWRAHPACGALISQHCESCDHFVWVKSAMGHETVRCRRMGCPSTCRKKFLDVTVPCPLGHSRDGAPSTSGAEEAVFDA